MHLRHEPVFLGVRIMVHTKILIAALVLLQPSMSGGLCRGQETKPTVNDMLQLLATKQETIISFKGVLETTRTKGPTTRDKVAYQVRGDLMRLDQIQGTVEEALRAKRVVPVSLYFDGNSYWDVEGDLIIHSHPHRNPIAEDVFVRLKALKQSDLEFALTNAPARVCVFERTVSNPSFENRKEFTLDNPQVIAQMAQEGMSVEQVRANNERARQMLPRGRERLWFRTDNGFCFRWEQFDEHGQLMRKKEYADVTFNSTVSLQSLRPDTSNKQVVDAAWPYDQEIIGMIAKEQREKMRVPSEAINPSR
jgi:outer membrane lipoprotein-sorting protein